MNDIKTQLIINTLSREKYDELCAIGDIKYDQLYLVEDECLDAFNKRVINVATPIEADDAVTKNFVESQFVKITNIRNYIDNSKLYSINSTEYPYGTTYVDGQLNEYQKENTLTPKWDITIVQSPIPDLRPDEITLTWTGVTFGWEFKFRDKAYFGTNKTETADTSRVNSDGYIINAVRIWPKVDSYISKKNIYSKLSGITKNSQLTDVVNALVGLNSLLSAYDK